MNICLVSQEYPPETARGGIGTQTWNKARALAALRHAVHVVSSAPRPSKSVQTGVQEGVTVHRVPTPDAEAPVYGEAAYWMGYAWSVFRHLRGLASAVAFDIIDFAEYGGEGFFFLLDRNEWTWVPVVVQLHGPLSMFGDRIGWPDAKGDFYRVGTMMEESCIKAADGLMACSANIADFTAGRHQVPRESIEVVHCGVDAAHFSPPPADDDRFTRPDIVFVGNIAANKGLNTLIDAVLQLRHRHPGIRLDILGKGDDGQVKEIQERARREGAGDNVRYGGFVGRDRLPAFYRRAAVFASPAQHEPGVANVYIEAMACGCPVVASTTGGAPEAVQHGVTGFLVPPSDVDAAVAALDRLLTDPELCRRMGQAGRKRVDDYFSMEKYIARILAVYERAILNSRQKLARVREGLC